MKTTVYPGGDFKVLSRPLDAKKLKSTISCLCFIRRYIIFSLSFNKSSTVVIISYVQGPFLVQMKRKTEQGGNKWNSQTEERSSRNCWRQQPKRRKKVSKERSK